MHCRLVICPECDLLYANPMFPPKAIAEAYEEAAFGSQEEALFAARTYGRFLPEIIRQLSDREGALDIGTGDGAFLEVLLNQGFTRVKGIEPSKAPIQVAKEEIRPLIQNGLFNPRDYRKNSLRLVTCFQTFEHVVDPLKTVQGAYQILKEGGALFGIFHNRNSFSAEVLGEKSPIYDIAHLQLFSFQSARYLLEKAGFAQVSVKIVLNTYPLQYWLRLLPMPLKLKLVLLEGMKKTRLGKIPMPMPAGNMAVVGYKKAAARRP